MIALQSTYRTALMVLVLGLAGCQVAGQSSFDQCDVDVVLSPTTGAAGTEIVGTGGPQSDAYDTRVRFGSTDATLLDVTRDTCADCDSCRDTEDCTACEVCPACTSACAPCVQTVTFQVPDVTPGAAGIVITNRYGTSATLPFTVLDGDISDSGDSGL